MGFYDCGFCELKGEVYYDKDSLYVLTRHEVYVAPRMISHYVAKHGYCPPEEFQQAVIDSPEVGSDDYVRMFELHGMQIDPVTEEDLREFEKELIELDLAQLGIGSFSDDEENGGA